MEDEDMVQKLKQKVMDGKEITKEEAMTLAEADLDELCQAADEISRLDQLLSTGNEDSEIYKINQSGDGILSEETAYLVERSLDLYEATDGAFDIAIYPVMKVWG